MTLQTNDYGDNPFAPGVVQDTYIPDQLIAGPFPLVTQPIVVTGGPYPRGSVLGQVSAQPIEVVAGTNTGNGTVGSASLGAAALTGAYVLTATGSTTFSVVDPEGNALANATVGTAYSQEGLNLTISAGGTAFVAGDSFTINALPGAAGQYKLSVATASDGSQNPSCVLVDTMSVAGPVTAGAYFTGEFNGRALNYDASWTIETLRNALRSSTIFVKSSVSASDPTTNIL